MAWMQRIFNSIMGLNLSSYVGQKTMNTDVQEQWIPCRHGYDLYAHIHYPAHHSEPLPALVIVPGGLSSGTVYDREGEITANEIAAHGFIVLHYDPSGRGRSGGQENYWGRRHQDELIDVLNFMQQWQLVALEQIGVFSFSIGNAIAIGGLARNQPSFVRYLFDWEGPSNRFNITKNDSHKSLQAFPSSDIDFWFEREPKNFISDLRCGYFRYQALHDHMQARKKGHAIELVNLATKGKAAWTQLNGNPANMEIDGDRISEACWVAPWQNHKGRILRFLLEIARD